MPWLTVCWENTLLIEIWSYLKLVHLFYKHFKRKIWSWGKDI